jgi:hypothetical protein
MEVNRGGLNFTTPSLEETGGVVKFSPLVIEKLVTIWMIFQ